MMTQTRSGSWLALAAAVLGTFLIVAALAFMMRKYTPSTAVDAARVAERTKALAELRQAEADALNNYGWVDQAKGIVRLRIVDAMKMVERDWQNPPAARSNLLARVAKATFVPPPAPQKPSEFE